MHRIPHDQMCEIDTIRKEIDKVYRFPFYLIGDRFTEDSSQPLTDIYETEDNFIVSCDLPFLQSDQDISIHVQDDQIMISGILTSDDYDLKTVKFSRAIRLPINVSSSQLNAVYQSGLLKIYISKDSSNSKSIAHPVNIEFLN